MFKSPSIASILEFLMYSSKHFFSFTLYSHLLYFKMHKHIKLIIIVKMSIVNFIFLFKGKDAFKHKINNKFHSPQMFIHCWGYFACSFWDCHRFKELWMHMNISHLQFYHTDYVLSRLRYILSHKDSPMILSTLWWAWKGKKCSVFADSWHLTYVWRMIYTTTIEFKVFWFIFFSHLSSSESLGTP